MADTEVVHLLGLVGLYDHTKPVELRNELKQLRKDAKAVGDNEVVGFLDSVEERFHSYLHR